MLSPLKYRLVVWALLLAGMSAAAASAQSVAIITPNKSSLDERAAQLTRLTLSGTLRVQDLGMSDAALEASGKRETAANLDVADAQQLSTVIGCDFFIVIETGTQRRTSLEKGDHFESFASFFVVSGRTGRLLKWKLFSGIGKDASDAEQHLMQSITATEFLSSIVAAWKSEAAETRPALMELVPEPDSPGAKNFRAPVPFRRLKPEYTRMAYLYDVTATVEATIDLNEKGEITRVEITRWAGYGLDERVQNVIKSMNWRPAERGGKPLPIRFLVRYNFKKIEKDDNE